MVQPAGDGLLRIDGLEHLAPGVYLLQLQETDTNRRTVFRLLKQPAR